MDGFTEDTETGQCVQHDVLVPTTQVQQNSTPLVNISTEETENISGDGKIVRLILSNQIIYIYMNYISSGVSHVDGWRFS